MNENQEAQALARWLEEHPGQAPPPGIDPEVIEALYALRPDLAPPPNVRIDDIFAAVESGPFATAANEENMITEEVVSLEAERAKRVPNEVAPASLPAVRRAWWSAPGMGALAAAALALVVILPTAGILMMQTTADLETATPTASPPAPAQKVGADTVTKGPQTEHEEAAPASEAAAPAAAEPPARRDSNEVLRRQEAKKSDGMEDDRGAADALAAPADAAKPATIERERDADVQNGAVDDLDEQGFLEKTQPEAKMKSEEAAPAKEIESYGSASAGPSASGARSSRSKDAPAPAAPPAEPLAAVADESSTTPSPYGDISAASTDAALVAATDDSDDRKAMTAAWFLAQRQYERGDPDAAMATTTKGLRRSGNDDLRSDLTALQWTVAQSMRPTAAPVTDDQ